MTDEAATTATTASDPTAPESRTERTTETSDVPKAFPSLAQDGNRSAAPRSVEHSDHGPQSTRSSERLPASATGRPQGATDDHQSAALGAASPGTSPPGAAAPKHLRPGTVAVFRLPLELDHVGRICKAIADAYPGCTIGPGAPNEMVFLEASPQ